VTRSTPSPPRPRWGGPDLPDSANKRPRPAQGRRMNGGRDGLEGLKYVLFLL
jgi:hypothetical protein